MPDSDMRFFSYREFAARGHAELPMRYHSAVRKLVRLHLDPLRSQFGKCTVHSGQRTATHNRAVGGAPRSKHVYRRQSNVAAADVSFARGTPQEWADWVLRHCPPCGLGVYADHLHVDNRGHGAFWRG